MDIFILEPISNTTVNHVLQEIIKQKESKDEDLRVYLNSPGGDVQAGYAIYELLKLSGRKVITYAINEVFSCAVAIYLAGEERYATNYSQFMIHEPYHEFEQDDNSGLSMTTSSYKKNLKELEEVTNEYFKVISKHTALTPQKIKNAISKTKSGDWYITAVQAKKFSIVTKIGVSLT
jgi:ATP-dependent Clp protease protease subunit